MQLIKPTIKSGDKGVKVANLKAALLFLYEHDVFKSYRSPNMPTAKELKTLIAKVAEEQQGFDKSTQTLVRYFQIQQGLGDNLRGVVDDKTASAINAFLKKLNALEETPALRVFGTVLDSSKQPQPGVVVTAWDRDLRKRQLLGTAKTSDDGNYSIAYSIKDFAPAEVAGRTRPWLIVEVKRDDKGRVEASTEITADQVTADQRVDFVLDVSSDASITEFDRATKLITPLLEGQGSDGAALLPSELKDDDMQFIATETGLNRAVVESWSGSYRMQQLSMALLGKEYPGEAALIKKLGWMLFYALGRQLSTYSLSTVCLRTVESRSSAIKLAQQQRQISSVDADNVAMFNSVIDTLKRLLTLQSNNSVTTPLTEVLSVLDLDASTRIKVAAVAIMEQSGDDPDALQSLRKDFPADTQVINRLIQGMRLHQLTSGNSTMMKLLQSHLGNNDSLAPLSGLSAEDWQQYSLKAEIDLPAAMTMLNKVELAHPVESLQSRIDSGKLQFSAATIDGINQLVKKNPAAVQNYLDGHTSTLKKDTDVVVNKLISVGLFGRLGLPYEAGSMLIDADIDTPALITRHGRETIIDILKDRHGDKAASLWADKTIKVINDARLVGVDVILGGAPYQYVPPGWYIKPSKPAPEIRDNLPSIPALMGDLDECICAPCESMLGQPAYLVDLLELLDKPNANGMRPVDKLRERRPDIFTLPLGCDAANTEVQHIDLANATMENALINDSRTTGHRFDRATLYKHLANQPYPWSLPFDAKFAETNAWLGRLGTSARKLDELTQHGWTREQVAASLLGVPYSTARNGGSAEWVLFTTVAQGDALWKLYGFSPDANNHVTVVDPASSEVLVNQPVTQVINRISILLERTGLDLDAFEALIQQPYVGGLTIDNRGQCKTSVMRLNIGNQNLETCFDRIHRMVRLQRKLNWSFADVGNALSSLSQSMPLSDVMVTIANIQWLTTTYHLQPGLLLALPQSFGAVAHVLGLRETQYQCLSTLSGIQLDTSTSTWESLKNFLAFQQLADATGWTVPELASLVLSRNELVALLPELPAYWMSEQVIATKAAELRNAIDRALEGLRTQAETDPSFTRVTLTTDEMATLVSDVFAMTEQQALVCIEFSIGNSRKLKEVIGNSADALANEQGIIDWIDRVSRLELLKSKVDSVLFDALLRNVDWYEVIASTATTRYDAINNVLCWLELGRGDQLGSLPSAACLNADVASNTSFDELVDAISIRFDVNASYAGLLLALKGFTAANVALFKKGMKVKALIPLFAFVRQWQATPSQLTELLSGNVSSVVASLLCARYGYDDDEWIEVQRSIENPVRQQGRDALVAALILSNPLFSSADDIYEHYLIDPSFEPCMKTTAVLEAITATQLFAQRVLFGMEKYNDSSGGEHTLLASEELKNQWTWMRNYRVWEANRKVFLFPENWLYPELRDDKSSSFNLLESELGSGELNPDLATRSFGKFLDDIVQLARIQVLGMCMDKSGAEHILYAIGRVPNPPYTYYWRKCLGYGTAISEWTPWYRIELDIQGEHVLPFIQHRSLHIAWPVLKREGQQQTFTLSYYWSRLSGGSWEKPQASVTAYDLPQLAFISIEDSFTFRCIQPNDDETKFVCFASAILDEANADRPVQGILSSDNQRANQDNKSQLIQRWFSQTGLVQFVAPAHDSEPTHVYGYPLLNWSYYGVDDNWTYINAVHLISWEVRILAKSSNGATSYVKINRDPGGTSNPQLRLQSSVDNTPFFSRRLGEDLAACIAEHIDITHIPSFECFAEFRGIQSQRISPPEVQQGRFVHSHLSFVIEPQADRIPTLAELGIADPSTLLPVAEFTIDRTGESRWNFADTNAVPLVLPGTLYFRNGLQGGAEGSWPLALPLAGDFAVMPPFKPVANDVTRRNYWVLGTSDLESAASGGMNWWYKNQDGTSCFISIDGNARPITAYLIPSSYNEASQVRKVWLGGGDIESCQYLPISFGADNLPEPKATSFAELWQRIRSGALAFDSSMPYACYNWEIFFHAPLYIADQLSKQHQFEAAERWLRYVFDPASTEPGSDASRFLKFRVFKELDTNNQVIDDLKAIAQAAAGYFTEADVDRINKLIDRWRQLPFRPFVIARSRQIAFLWQTLFAYLDNLITWADSLYRLDTRESNNEALMLYVLAYRILGRRPKQYGGASDKAAYNYDQLRDKLDAFSNYWVDVASKGGGNAIYTHGEKPDLINRQPPTSAGALLFCMPHNDKLDQYWNIVEERLFNLRHCRNMDGVARDLPLTDPPIDPALLVRATAAGLDLGSVVADLYAAPPHYRYGVLSARAVELANETRALGTAMLSAMERRDAEQLAQLRSTHEIALLQQVGELKKLQISEAEANVTALRASRTSLESRYNQYQRLLGLDGVAPVEGGSTGEVSVLGQLNKGSSSPRSGLGLIVEEGQQYVGIEGANTWSTAATISKLVASGLHASSSIVAAAMSSMPLPNPPKVLEAVGNAASTVGDSFSFIAQSWRTYAEQQGLLAGHLRRRDEWAFQSNQVLKELQQIDKQILANQIRIDMARKELANQGLQLEQSQAVEEVMRSKFTNTQLYDWMTKELYALYNQAYRMALDMARKAQRAASKELGLMATTLNNISNDHWNSTRQGLLAGERLYQDLKRLDAAYMELNTREFELTKHISLRRLDPAALVNLRITQKNASNQNQNQCEFELPEWLFDLDTPGHCLRRIKSVSVSIPCVVGPYTSVHCRLTMLKSSIRYPSSADMEEMPGSIEAVVTSTANADSGLFETSLRDERFLPFEGRGVISRWRLELPADYPQFDYSTISDVILTVRYTARDGNDQLKQHAVASIPKVDAATMRNFPVLVSSRSDFASDWMKAQATGGDLHITFSQDLLPYWMSRARAVTARKMLLGTGAQPAFEDIVWNNVDPLPLGPVSGCDDILVLLECQMI